MLLLLLLSESCRLMAEPADAAGAAASCEVSANLAGLLRDHDSSCLARRVCVSLFFGACWRLCADSPTLAVEDFDFGFEVEPSDAVQDRRGFEVEPWVGRSQSGRWVSFAKAMCP